MANELNLSDEEKAALESFGFGDIIEDNIITPDEMVLLRGFKKLVPRISAQLEKANRAGIDIGTNKTELSAASQRIDDILRIYGD